MTTVQFTVGAGIFFFVTTSRLGWVSTQLPIQWAPGAFPGGKWPGHEADHFHLVLRLRMCGTIPPLPPLPS